MVQEATRTVLITGGTGSVGEDLVAGFARLGYRVTFLYNASASKASAISLKTGASGVRMDLAESMELKDKEIDILINNAAINESAQLTADLPRQEWNRAIAINLTAPFGLIQQCLPHMIRRVWGRIINISSIYALRAVETNLPYTVSKHGLSGLTKTVAREYGSHGITCNEICPGPIRSRLLDRVCRERASAIGVSIEEYMREVKEEMPTGDLVLPSAVTQMALLLASDTARSVNGASLVIDCGMTA